MKKTFSQFLNESKIQVPPETQRKVMNVVAAAFFSDLARRIKIDGDEPSPEFHAQLDAAQQKYGKFNLHKLNHETPGLKATIPFHTKELPERYRKKLRDDYVIHLLTGPMGNKENSGEYHPMSQGRPGKIRINTMSAGNVDKLVYRPDLIDRHLHWLDATVNHELQHMVQDVALKRLHPSQTGDNDTRTLSQTDNDVYYNASEEYLPQITSAAALFVNSLVDDDTRESIQTKFYDAVDPRRNNDPYPFFAVLYKTDIAKWKKAVKELHRLVQNKI